MRCLVFVLFIALAASEFDPEIHRKFKTLPKHEFVSYFNSLNHSWTIAEYSDDIPLSYGAEFNANHGLPTITHDVMELPQQFDARQQWPQCETIQQIKDQGSCGSCYLFGTINSLSDRTCIHNDVHVNLSEQDGECLDTSKCVCEGGHPPDVLQFWIQNGLVTEDCKPYDIQSLYEQQCHEKCVNPSMDYFKDKHFGDSAYQVDSDVDTIRAELVKNGPVVVGMTVYEDFKDYRGGVYVHKYGKEKGHHALRLIGFGTDDSGVDYWLLANSWGTGRGEGGFYRIKRNQPEVGIESRVFAGLPRKN